MTRIATPIEQIKDRYTVVVIGSGYGGSIAASRFARAGKDVCLLERGREIQPGEYPSSPLEAAKEMQVDLPQKHLGSRSGLYDFHMNDDINVFVGCGLGGTSLVNANVSLRAEKRVFEDARWPQALRADADGLLAAGYTHAEAMLKPEPYPAHYPKLDKMQALETSAAHVQGKFYRPPVTVTFKDGINHVGVEQKACNNCGDCVSGCNYKAKNTLLMNYLPDARNFGAQIFCGASVRYVEKQGNGWLVHYQIVDSGQEKFDAPTQFVQADIVVLAAGTLGSTEILLRSKANGLATSNSVGKGFTGNGDVLAFGYNCDQPINGIGHGNLPHEDRPPVGPCITGIIDMREQGKLEDGMVIEEGSMPGPLAPIYPQIFAATAKAIGHDTDSELWDEVREKTRELESLQRGAYHGAMKRTQTYLVMSHDDAKGEMSLGQGRLRISWKSVGKQPVFEKINKRLLEATTPLGGTFVPNPIWSELFNHRLVTVHPLGGCCMADDAQQGVVNHKGQVFATTSGTAVYDGLYVADGAVMPRSLGVNPLLTISAVAERSVALACQQRGWNIDYKLPSKPPANQPKPVTGVRFTETMRGFFAKGATGDTKADYEAAYTKGKQAKSPFEFTLTIIASDLDKLLDTPTHEGRILGTVTAPTLSAQPLTVTNGWFNLFVPDASEVNTRRMQYRMQLTAEDGARYFFNGYKTVRSDAMGLDAWADTTTLYITVHKGENDSAPVLGKGLLKIEPLDFVTQMTTMQVTDAPNLKARLKAMARFGHYFGGSLWDTYGSIARAEQVFNPDAPPRIKRPLRVGNTQVHFCRTADGAELRLTRYQGGKKGPVMLVHGLGVSSRIFTIDTIDTNLVEYLYANGYDVWCLDYRASIELPASKALSSGDDVATKDYPAAVHKILQVTGASSIQAVAHCWGSTTFFMSLLAGLPNVRSLVASQIATHIKAPVMTKLKTGLHLPEFLQKIGVNSLSAYVDTHRNWGEVLYDKALKAYPTQLEEVCNNPVCRRIAFMYAPLYEHAQLNKATHEAMHEMFGVANMKAFEHLATLVTKGHLVDVQGKEAYLPHLERLNMPITFIHGAENACFHPESTEITYKLLCGKFGASQYQRHVISGYGHIDCIYGKNADKDVYPHILAHLERG